MKITTPIEPPSDTEESSEEEEPNVQLDMEEIRQARLPQQLIVMENPDKIFHEKWYSGRNIVDIIHPFRCVCFGPPNVGKSTVVKNILLRAGSGDSRKNSKPFEEVFVIHCDPDYTKEYNDIDCEMLTEIPSPDQWQGDVKTLVVLEDLELKLLDKQQKRALDRLFGYVSTHKNISVICCSQDFVNIPPSCRRCANFWVIWKHTDTDAMGTIARRVGMDKRQMLDIFDRFMPNIHDSLWIDMTDGTRHKLRINGFSPLKLKKKKKSENQHIVEFNKV